MDEGQVSIDRGGREDRKVTMKTEMMDEEVPSPSTCSCSSSTCQTPTIAATAYPRERPFSATESASAPASAAATSKKSIRNNRADDTLTHDSTSPHYYDTIMDAFFPSVAVTDVDEETERLAVHHEEDKRASDVTTSQLGNNKGGHVSVTHYNVPPMSSSGKGEKSATEAVETSSSSSLVLHPSPRNERVLVMNHPPGKHLSVVHVVSFSSSHIRVHPLMTNKTSTILFTTCNLQYLLYRVHLILSLLLCVFGLI